MAAEIGFTVGVELGKFAAIERNAYARGICQSYGAVFERFSEAFRTGGDMRALLETITADFEYAHAAMVVRGVA